MNCEFLIKINFVLKGIEYIVFDFCVVFYKCVYDFIIYIMFGSGNFMI